MILISPYSKPLRTGGNNPKNYPFWQEVLKGLNGEKVLQIGLPDEKKICKEFYFPPTLGRVKELLLECDTWVSVDNFLPHVAHHVKKPGVVIFGQSDPNIFGYHENINLLKSREYLRKDQFLMWEQCEYKTDAFVDPEVVLESIRGGV
jgi:ADP-heptose:LPS heptosyltransferase